MKNNDFQFPLYVGGFMGPFGASIILPMFPELRETFNASSQAVGWGSLPTFFHLRSFCSCRGHLGNDGEEKKLLEERIFCIRLLQLFAQLPQILLFF